MKKVSQIIVKKANINPSDILQRNQLKYIIGGYGGGAGYGYDAPVLKCCYRCVVDCSVHQGIGSTDIWYYASYDTLSCGHVINSTATGYLDQCFATETTPLPPGAIPIGAKCDQFYIVS